MGPAARGSPDTGRRAPREPKLPARGSGEDGWAGEHDWPRARRGGGGVAAGESFSENVLASPSEFPYSTSSHGGVAQLGERLTGSQEVRGSIPLVSTRALNQAPTQVGAFFQSIAMHFSLLSGCLK